MWGKETDTITLAGNQKSLIFAWRFPSHVILYALTVSFLAGMAPRKKYTDPAGLTLQTQPME